MSPEERKPAAYHAQGEARPHPDTDEVLPPHTHLLAWERMYNTVRPHQALDYRIPSEFCQQGF
jgi:transposase InsO family protein